MAYAILRFAKHKGGASKALSAHHERTKEEYASNPDIDKSRIAQNYHLVTPRWSYEQEIRHRIRTAGCRVRKDSVKFVDTLVTVSPEFAKAHDAEMPEYFNRAFEFLKERIGEVWGDRIFEKCGIRRDEGGDGGKTLEIRGKRRLSARDGGANYQQS